MSTLSPPQAQIADLVREGVNTVSGLAKRLGKSEGIIRAQLTRIRNAGQGHQVSSVQDDMAQQTSAPPRSHQPSMDRPRSSGSSSNEGILEDAKQGGQAEYEIPPEMAQQFANQFGGKTDVHPMVLLGVTIQYVKLVGGRLSAHQMIEQVYDALRTMVGDGSPKVGQEQWSAPWPLDSTEAENEALKNRIADLEKQLGAQS